MCNCPSHACNCHTPARFRCYVLSCHAPPITPRLPSLSPAKEVRRALVVEELAHDAPVAQPGQETVAKLVAALKTILPPSATKLEFGSPTARGRATVGVAHLLKSTSPVALPSATLVQKSTRLHVVLPFHVYVASSTVYRLERALNLKNSRCHLVPVPHFVEILQSGLLPYSLVSQTINKQPENRWLIHILVCRVSQSMDPVSEKLSAFALALPVFSRHTIQRIIRIPIPSAIPLPELDDKLYKCNQRVARHPRHRPQWVALQGCEKRSLLVRVRHIQRVDHLEHP